MLHLQAANERAVFALVINKGLRLNFVEDAESGLL